MEKIWSKIVNNSGNCKKEYLILIKLASTGELFLFCALLSRAPKLYIRKLVFFDDHAIFCLILPLQTLQ